MSDFIDIEHAKNMQAMRRISTMAFTLAAIIILSAYYKFWHASASNPSLENFIDVIVPSLILLVARFFKTLSSKKLAKQNIGRKKRQD